MIHPLGQRPANRLLRWSSAMSKRHSFVDRSVGFITLLSGGFLAPLTCMACGMRDAEGSWVVDLLGGIHGRCTDCADFRSNRE
jgi:hypothetical protein